MGKNHCLPEDWRTKQIVSVGGTNQKAVSFLIYSYYIFQCCLSDEMEMFRNAARSHPEATEKLFMQMACIGCF